MEKFLLISIGAVLGTNARYWLSTWAAGRWGTAFPYGTLIINLSGSFLLGLFMSLAAERFLIDPRLRLLVTVGFFGAYTTFSTYAFESIALIGKGEWGAGIFNLLGSSILGLICVGLGVYLGKSI